VNASERRWASDWRRQFEHPGGEAAFQAQVLDLAGRLGWTHYHPYDSRRSNPGFPDLVLVRDRVIFAELKTQLGRLSSAQAGWRDRLLAAGAEWHLWRPDDLPAIAWTLGRHHTTAESAHPVEATR
jgi:hypothetical protein